MDWFLYDKGLRHEKVKEKLVMAAYSYGVLLLLLILIPFTALLYVLTQCLA